MRIRKWMTITVTLETWHWAVLGALDLVLTSFAIYGIVRAING